jgi:2-polyprenyl-6-hydroxyphenyl methylase/3-demethylubiquinone-9 3-methyltransferase
MCYDIAPPRTQQYLNEEINFVLKHIKQSDTVIELGCGYGRVLQCLTEKASRVVGIDTSLGSLHLASEYVENQDKLELFQMDAIELGFKDNQFEVVVCIQNGISAFKREPMELVRQAVRIATEDGVVLFSSYSDAFWDHRLEWFILQSESGLLGEIDWDATREGVIVCEDGFRATTFSREDFSNLASSLGIDCQIIEVDKSSLFCKFEG